MKTRPVTVWSMVFGAVALLTATAGAQVPFSSTQAPGLSPFNRSNGLPVNTPPPRASNNPPGQMPYATAGNMPGGYPMANAVTGPIDPDHKLGPHDVVSYSVAEDRDDKVYHLMVTDSGELELPLGSLRVKATGKTTQQLTSDVKSVLEREYYKPGHASVKLGLDSAAPNASRGKVYFTGEIISKGAIDLPAEGQLMVIQAILQLGGFTVDADQKRVYIYRKGAPKKGIQVNGKAVLAGEGDKDVPLEPGDTVKVERKFIGVSF